MIEEKLPEHGTPVPDRPVELVPESKVSEAPLSAIAREVADSLKDVVRSEVKLAKAEAKDSVSYLKSDLVKASIFGGIAAIGVLPLMSFLVIGLGRIMNNNYWLSSLVVAVLCFGIGGLMARSAVAKMREHKPTMDRTKRTVGQEVDVLKSKVRDISDRAKRRMA